MFVLSVVRACKELKFVQYGAGCNLVKSTLEKMIY